MLSRTDRLKMIVENNYKKVKQDLIENGITNTEQFGIRVEIFDKKTHKIYKHSSNSGNGIRQEVSGPLSKEELEVFRAMYLKK